MADKKISELTGATTPLAGTEVLPIVQGGSVKCMPSLHRQADGFGHPPLNVIRPSAAIGNALL